MFLRLKMSFTENNILRIIFNIPFANNKRNINFLLLKFHLYTYIYFNIYYYFTTRYMVSLLGDIPVSDTHLNTSGYI